MSTFRYAIRALLEASVPVTFTNVALLMLLVATRASYIASRRALRVDAIVALRTE